MPTPSWHGVRRVPIASEICLPAALAESLRRVHPTAIGLIPPSFSRAIRVAPKKEGRIEAGQFSLMMKLVRAVRALRSAVPPASAEAPIMSCRCWGLRPSGPPADPLGKDRILRATSSSDTVRWLWASSSDGMSESGWGSGCFCLRAASVESLMSAIMSSEQAIRTAPLKSPSSILKATRVASRSSGLRGLAPRPLQVVREHAGGSASSLMWLLMAVARFRRLPPLCGARRHRIAKHSRRSHARWLFHDTAASARDASFLAATSREARGIRLMIFTGGFGGKSVDEGRVWGGRSLADSGWPATSRPGGGLGEGGGSAAALGNLLEGSGRQGMCTYYRLGHARRYGLPLSGP